MSEKYIGAIDQGTTSSRFIIFNRKGEIVSSAQMPHKQYYPKPGWVEHDAVEILENTLNVINKALKKAKLTPADLEAIGITNQRETTIVWDKESGKPLHKAIVWQDTRTEKLCRDLEKKKGREYFYEKTGLPISTYFSASKIKWLCDNVTGIGEKIKNGTALIGTIDTWILWNLNGGEHYTDITNASRTLLFNINEMKWDDELLKLFKVPETSLPTVLPSINSKGFGNLHLKGVNTKVPITCVLGDQQAALFGQTCFKKGEAKSTYGTGAFLLMNIGTEVYHSKFGLLTTPAYSINGSKPVYALEGSIAMAGSLVQWFRDNMRMIDKSDEIETLALESKDNGGVYCVPAFSGLFAPYWCGDAEGLVTGLTHHTNRSHLARAVLEATAYQSRDVFDAMQKDTGINLKSLKVDGGMTVNELLMQFQADILDTEVVRPKIAETTCLGAAFGAGLAVGYWKDLDEIKKIWTEDKEWKPKMKPKVRTDLITGWEIAIRKSKRN